MPAELADELVATEADRLMQAEALVRSYCGWHIAPSRTESFTDTGAGSAGILLPSLHVTAITSVVDDGATLTTDEFDWSEAGVVSGRTWSGGKVVVEFVHGYAEPPAEVTGVVQAVAQRALDNPGSKPRQQTGPFADTYSQVGFNQAPTLALLDAEKEILAPYRRKP